MHGGLLCVLAFRLCVTIPKAILDPTGAPVTRGPPIDLEVKGHMGQGQRSCGSRSNKGPKQRQVGSRQCQVASLLNFKISQVMLIP